MKYYLFWIGKGSLDYVTEKGFPNIDSARAYAYTVMKKTNTPDIFSLKGLSISLNKKNKDRWSTYEKHQGHIGKLNGQIVYIEGEKIYRLYPNGKIKR